VLSVAEFVILVSKIRKKDGSYLFFSFQFMNNSPLLALNDEKNILILFMESGDDSLGCSHCLSEQVFPSQDD